MIDTIKQFFASLHELPAWLRNAFGLLFFGTMIVVVMTFKNWLVMRRTTKDTDYWACVPVTPALVAACCWGLWASASVYHLYLEDAAKQTTQQAAVPAKDFRPAMTPGSVAGAASRSIHPALGTHPRALPEADNRAPRSELGGTVIASQPVHARTAHADSAPPAETAGAASTAHIGTAADSTAPVAPPAVAPKSEGDEPLPAPHPTKPLAKRLKSKRHAPTQTANATEAAPAAAQAPVAPAPVEQAPAKHAASADGGPRFIVEHPAEAAPAAPAPAAH